MKPVPPWALSNWPATGCAGMTATQQVMPPSCSTLSRAQVPSGVRIRPMFSLATVTAGFGFPLASRTGRPRSSAFLLNANSCAPLKKPPPKPGSVAGRSGNSS